MQFTAIKRFLGTARDGNDVARAFARCFNENDGQIVLEYLHQQVMFRVAEPNQSDEHLRFMEGQRQLLLFICQVIAKGRTE